MPVQTIGCLAQIERGGQASGSMEHVILTTRTLESDPSTRCFHEDNLITRVFNIQFLVPTFVFPR